MRMSLVHETVMYTVEAKMSRQTLQYCTQFSPAYRHPLSKRHQVTQSLGQLQLHEER